MTRADVEKQLKEFLTKFVGDKNNKAIREKINLGTQKLLANIEADLYGYKIERCDTMWNMFSLKQKTQWYWSNKITSKGAKERKRIDKINAAKYQEYLEELENCEEWELDDINPERIKYPEWAESNPKSIIKTEFKIKINQPVEFITTELEFNGLEAQIGKKNS